MCGIVGRAGVLKTDDERIFKTLLLLDYFRGQDSTGVAVVSKKGKVDVFKIADDPIMLFQNVGFDSTVVGISDAIWIGHNRAATVGSTTRANAHPFQCNHITGVHNGTLEKPSFFEIGERLDEEYGTDSETIFQHIAKYGVDETIPLLEGAWALVWYNEKDQTLNMLKNSKRPLYLAKTERNGNKLLTWASEFKMISAARAMADTSDGKLILDEKGYGFFPLPDNLLHTWTKEQLLAGDLEPVTKELHGKPDPVKTTPAFWNNACGTGNNYGHNPTGTPTSTTTHTKGVPFPLVEDIHEVTDVEVDDNKMILGVFEAEEWAELTKFGCSCCGADVYPDEEGLVVYANEGVIVCPICSEEPTTTVVNAFGMQLNDRIIG
jgi:predicted glutamine amidotransferase